MIAGSMPTDDSTRLTTAGPATPQGGQGRADSAMDSDTPFAAAGDADSHDQTADLQETELDESELDEADADHESSVQIASTRTEALYRSSLENACTAARICDELRGQNIVVLDLTRITSIVDFFVIVTGNSRRQMHAIADEVNRKLKHEDGNRRISIEGYRTEGNWILTDYGDVVLHVFTAEGRELYNLEQLWADAVRIDWKTGQPLTAASATESSRI